MQNNTNRPTIYDVAREAGVSHSTVSRALREDPQISSATTKRVLEAAKLLGYRPNPFISVLMSHVRRRKKPGHQAALAFMETAPREGAWNEYSAFRRIFIGATQRAESQGYQLERFWLQAKGMTAARMASILHARGIQGIIFQHLPDTTHANEPLDFPFGNFASVAVGTQLISPRLHYVGEDNYGNLYLVWNILRSRGFRRIGLITNRYNEDRTQHRQSACHAFLQQQMGASERIPLHYLEPNSNQSAREWFRRNRPEIVINAGEENPDCFNADVQAVPVVYLDYQPESVHGLFGVDQNHEFLGSGAVDILLGQLLRGERGIPSQPKIVLISGDWKIRHAIAEKALHRAAIHRKHSTKKLTQ